MSQLANWLEPLQQRILAQAIRTAALPEIQAVRFVCRWEWDPAVLWVGQGSELLTLLKARNNLSGMTFFAAGDAGGLLSLARERGVNLIVTDLALTELHEVLSAVLRRYQGWSLQLLKALGQRQGIRGVVDATAKLTGGALFLLNGEGRVTCFGGSACLDSAPAQELLWRGQLSSGTLLNAAKDGPDGLYCRPLDGGGKCWVQRVREDNGSVSYLVLFTSAHWHKPDVLELLRLVRGSLEQVSAVEKGSCQVNTDLKQFLSDLLSGKLTEEEEIDRRLSALPRPAQRFCTFIVVEPVCLGALPTLPAPLLSQLEAIFPGSNAAFYGGSAVLLVSRSDRDFQPIPAFDRERFQELLARYDLYAGVSNATSRRLMLRTTYLLTKSVLQLGQALRFDKKARIFFFEDYAEYIAIDLCINSFISLMGHDDIIYLSHPGMVKLYRYDAANKTNLLDVLYFYCLSNCSVSQAAKAVYMHRNTFSARLAKIQELFQEDLSNGEIQQRIIFSYKVLRYYDHYAKVNLRQRLGIDGEQPKEGKE